MRSSSNPVPPERIISELDRLIADSTRLHERWDTTLPVSLPPPISCRLVHATRDVVPRIHGELRTLGVEVSERTVSRLLEPHTRPRSQTWKTFLKNHLTAAAAVDFFTVPTLTGRVLFALIVLSHRRRRIAHFNVTEHPTATWAARQVVEAFPDDTAPRWLHRDRDSVYGESFRQRVAGMGIGEVVSAVASPWQNPSREHPGHTVWVTGEVKNGAIVISGNRSALTALCSADVGTCEAADRNRPGTRRAGSLHGRQELRSPVLRRH